MHVGRAERKLWFFNTPANYLSWKCSALCYLMSCSEIVGLRQLLNIALTYVGRAENTSDFLKWTNPPANYMTWELCLMSPNVMFLLHGDESSYVFVYIISMTTMFMNNSHLFKYNVLRDSKFVRNMHKRLNWSPFSPKLRAASMKINEQTKLINKTHITQWQTN